jgi:hypothetical protein
MCKSDGETIDHLFLQCSVARELWDFILFLIGTTWVMPKRVLDLLSSWTGLCGKKSSKNMGGYSFLFDVDYLERGIFITLKA